MTLQLKFFYFLVLCAELYYVNAACPSQTGLKTITYSSPTGPKLSGNFLMNPERGFYQYSETLSSAPTPLVLNDLQSIKSISNVTVLYRYFVLDRFLTANISSTFLSSIAADFGVIRQAGMKIVVRFCYTLIEGNNRDAALTQLLNHITQVKPILQSNADVILVVQAGFIGTWGEWYYSNNYGLQPDGSYEPISTNQWNSRQRIISALLDAVPVSRMVQIRYVPYIQRYCNTTSNLMSSNAFSGTKCARLGLHNDCFLNTFEDSGTFETTAQRTWLTEQAKYVMVGGETCALNGDFTKCPNSLNQIAAQRFTYLNNGYNEDVIAGWTTGGCLNTIEGMLGYRYQLHNGTFPTSVSRSGSFCATLFLENTGVAPVYNQRKVQVVLRNQASKNLTFFDQMSIDSRRWAPNSISKFDLTFTVPGTMLTGTYDVILNLADTFDSLANIPAYRILVANPNVQEKATRFNILTSVDIV